MTSNEEFFRLANEARQRVREVTPRAALLLGLAGAIVIDVRDRNEFDAGHIPGAFQIGQSQLEQDIAALAPDLAGAIVCYCTAGFRSALAADALQKRGYSNVVSIAGGFKAYLQEAEPPALAA